MNTHNGYDIEELQPGMQAGRQCSSLTVLIKSRHYANFFKQEVSLDEGVG